MKAMIVVGMISALVLVSSEAVAQEFTTREVLAKLDEKASVFSSLQASITSVHVEYTVKQPSESGKLYIKMARSSPRILWDITSPADLRKTALIDNGVGTVYFRKSNTYARRSVDPNGEVLQLLLIGFGVPSATFSKVYSAEVKGSEVIDSVKTVVLELTSTSPTTSKFPKVTLWLDPRTWTPAQTRLAERSKSYTDFKYSSVVLNRGVPDSKFRLNIPKDAQQQ